MNGERAMSIHMTMRQISSPNLYLQGRKEKALYDAYSTGYLGAIMKWTRHVAEPLIIKRMKWTKHVAEPLIIVECIEVTFPLLVVLFFYIEG